MPQPGWIPKPAPSYLDYLKQDAEKDAEIVRLRAELKEEKAKNADTAT